MNEQFLNTTGNEAKSFVEIHDELTRPPFGVKAGILPILYTAVYLANKENIAIYESKVYKPEFTDEMIERFIKRPDEFQFQKFAVQNIKKSALDAYAKAFNKKDLNILEATKSLHHVLETSSQYTKHTKLGLSKEARQIRSAFKLAKSPERLLYNDLPLILGFTEITDKTSGAELNSFSKHLKKVRLEIQTAYQEMLREKMHLLADKLGIEKDTKLSRLQSLINKKFVNLDDYAAEIHLKSFIKALSNEEKEPLSWLESLLTLLTIEKKHPTRWTDDDSIVANRKLTALSAATNELKEIAQQHYHQQDDGTGEIVTIRLLQKGRHSISKTTTIDHTDETSNAILTQIECLSEKQRLNIAAQLLSKLNSETN